MSAEKPKKPRLKGFPKLIGSLVDIAMKKQECQEYVKAIKTRVLFNNLEDKKWAVLISVINDSVIVEGIEKDLNFDIKKVGTALRAWGWWEISSFNTILEAGEWKSGKWFLKMAGKKTKGASQIGIIGEILSFANSSK